jgi:hypothetical protein
MGFGTMIHGFKTEVENPFTRSIRFDLLQFQEYCWKLALKWPRRATKGPCIRLTKG